MQDINLIIRKSKTSETLVLARNCEGVYFIFFDGRQIENDLNYDRISDKYTEFEKSLTE